MYLASVVDSLMAFMIVDEGVGGREIEMSALNWRLEPFLLENDGQMEGNEEEEEEESKAFVDYYDDDDDDDDDEL
jgi:hypothetical protein